MDLEIIVKLIDAGYTKAEIDAMTSKVPEAPAQEKTEETPAPAEPISAAEPETPPVKKNSSDSSEDDRIKTLEDKLSTLEQKYYSRNLQEASAPVPPPEDNSIVGIFTKVFTED